MGRGIFTTDYRLGFPVDPDDQAGFQTINAAVAYADSILPDGEPIVLRLAPKTHNLEGGQITFPNTRSILIQGGNSFNSPDQTDERCAIVGDMICPAADGAATRLDFTIVGANIESGGAALTIGSNWKFNHIQGKHIGSFQIERTHGAAGAMLYFNNIQSYNGGILLTDTDAAPDARRGEIRIENCPSLSVDSANSPSWVFAGAVSVIVLNSYLGMFSTVADQTWMDLAGAASDVTFINSTIRTNTAFSGNNILFVNNGGAAIIYRKTTVVGNAPNTDFAGGAGTHSANDLFLTSDIEPLNPVENLNWLDPRTNEVLTWDGTYWDTGGGVKRHEIVLDVGGAAQDHDAGWAPPAGAAVVKASCRLLKDITLAGGATAIGHGTKAAGDPDKYGETASGAAGQTCQTVNPTPWPDGGGDDMAITSTNGAGAAAGTCAGSGDADVRLMYWFVMETELPS